MLRMILILALMSLSGTLAGQELKKSEPPQLSLEELALARRYKIEPEKLYPGFLTVKALMIQLREAEAEAGERMLARWSDGYKAGALEADRRRDGELFWWQAGAAAGAVFSVIFLVKSAFFH